MREPAEIRDTVIKVFDDGSLHSTYEWHEHAVKDIIEILKKRPDTDIHIVSGYDGDSEFDDLLIHIYHNGDEFDVTAYGDGDYVLADYQFWLKDL